MADSNSAQLSDTKPTRARLILVMWLCGLSSILYLDRICMAQAVTPIRDELHLSKTEMSYVMMAFTLAYGLCAVPVGRWGDQRGPRLVLTLIVIAWSAFTALTGAATGLITLICVRLLFGAAEAGAFPNAAKIVSRWYPVSQRGRVQGVLLAFAQVGAIVAPAAAAYLIETMGWRWSFGVFSLVGFAWAIGFWFWFRDDPARHPGVNEAELAEIHCDEPPPPADPGPVPWRAVLTNRGIIVLAVIMILASFFTYFFYTWFPTYLGDGRGVGNVKAGWLTSLVIAGSAIGMLLGGWLSDRISRRSANPIRDRRYVSMAGFLIAAVCLFAGTRCDDAISLAVLWSASMCAMHIQLPNWWSAIIPQAGRHVATLFGLTNGIGVFGAMTSQGFAAWFADYQEQTRGLKGRAAWDPMFDVYVLVLILGAVAWWLYRFTPLEDSTALVKEEENW
jgi:MFS family permease